MDEDEFADVWEEERDTTFNQPAQHITEEVRPTNNYPINDGLTKNLVEKRSMYDQNPRSGLQEARNDRLGVTDVKSSEAADVEHAQDIRQKIMVKMVTNWFCRKNSKICQTINLM